MEKNEIQLKVAEALQADVGRNIIRIDSKTREQLGVISGDIIEIKGKKSTAAIVWQARPQDEGLEIIRMDGYIRQNTKTGIGDKVKLKKADSKEAKKITLAPLQPIKYSPGFEEYVKKRLIGRAVTREDNLFIGVFGTSFPLVVANSQPTGIVIINNSTEVTLKSEPISTSPISQISYEDVGGLKEEVQKIREMVELPLRHPELFEKLGIDPPKGVLLHGSPGTGKTLLAKAVANESEAHFIPIAGPELVSKFVGESEEKLREVFREAEENAPSIIFMDELDSLAPKREEVSGEVEKRMVSQLLSLMDGLKARGEVIVIGATNRVNSIDPALRRPGRFDRELEIGVPDRKDRKEILMIHTRGMPLEKDVDLDELASITHGYTGADISSLIREAAMRALRRIIPQIDLESETIPPEIIENLNVKRDDFFEAIKGITPSALREVFVEHPNVKWEDIGGLEKEKRELKEAIELPLKNPDIFSKMGIRPIKGILLVGLPGTGKTLLAKAVANESESNFISIKGPAILSKWVGESEKMVREIFRKAKLASPCVIFIDEIDAIAPRRGRGSGDSGVMERLVDTLLTEMDGLSSIKDIVVIAASNRPDILDPALLRPGRFDRVLDIPMPEEDTRLEILKVHTSKMPLDKNVDLKEIASETDSFSGADLENLCREAGMEALRENIKTKQVSKKHFERAKEIIKPSTKKEYKERLEKFKESTSYMFG
ncbi:CDC48 family AAA ATPase [Candidatus Micrarchaeota archaeon]|nr:CDC48 family AAA ATPase [Candidatus Micrarchaeota archaeon]